VLIAGNWKMFKGPAEAGEFCRALREADLGSVDVVVCPPYVSLGEAVQALAGTEIGVAAQNVHWAADGAFTGEVSAPMLRELGVYGTIVGHSERRQYFGETDRALALKVPAALAAGLTPILCIGETEGERDNDDTDRKLRQQVKDDLAGVPAARLHEVVIAYEPIWAIGTGRVATAAQVQEAIVFIRALVGDRDEQAADAVRILYGGSVNPDNASELLALDDVDGALVGGASLEAESFARIVSAAAR
jgi:triosephosphate isomerase (TIM)